MLFALTTVGHASANSRAFVEIGDTDGALNPVMVRRLIALELTDIVVPGNPRIPGDDPRDVTLHCRVLPEDGALRVEIWERGESAGARRVSLQGSAALVARRVALAAAELARRLAHIRHEEARRLEREELEAERVAELERQRQLRRRMALGARFDGVGFARGAYWMGPSLVVQLNGEHPFRIEGGLGWRAGQVTHLNDAPTWNAFEATLKPSWVHALGADLDVELGVLMTAALINTQRAVTVDRIEGQRETWTARAGIEARVQPRLSSHVRLDFGLAGGWTLRSVPLDVSAANGDGESMRLGGPWAQISLGALLD